MRKFFLFVLLCAATAVSAATKVETFTPQEGNTATYVTTETSRTCDQATWTFFSGGILTGVGNFSSAAAVIRAKKSNESVYPYIYSSTIGGGIDSLWLTWNANGNETAGTWNIKVYINNVEVGALNTAGTSKDATPSRKFGIGKLGIEGDFVIKFVNESEYSGTSNFLRFVFDDLSWTTYGAAEKETPDFAFAETSVIKFLDATAFTNTLTNTSDATPSFESSDPTIATVDENGKVTLTGKIGTTIISAAVVATDTYKAAEASYTLRVVPLNFHLETFTGAQNVTGNNTYSTTAVTSENPSEATGLSWTSLLGSVRDNLGGGSMLPLTNIAAAIRGKKTAEENYGYLLSSTITGGIDSLAFDWTCNGTEAARENPWNIKVYINDQEVGAITDACTAVPAKPYRFSKGGLKIDGDFTIKIVNNNVADDGTSNHYRWVVDNIEWYSYKAPVYSVAGAEALMGSSWNEKEGNELVKQTDGKYKLVREGVSLAVGDYEYKVVIDHKWDNGEAANNSVLSIDKAGKYDVTFTYDAAIPETSATAELKEEQIIIPTVKLAGISGWDGEEMTLAEDKKTCSISKSIEAGSYEFKVIVGGNWLGASQEFTRANNSYAVTANGDNMKLAADIAGEYTFTWTYETSTLEITFPAAPKFKIAGSMSDNWAPSIISFEDSYTFKNLAAGNHIFKVVDGDAWIGFSALTEAYKAVELYSDQNGNVCFTLAEAGDVVVTYIKDQVFKVEGNFVLPTVQIIGIKGWTAATDAVTLAPAEDKKSSSVKLNLDAWYYEFKMIVAGAWLGKENGDSKYELHSGWTSVDGLTYEGDNVILRLGDGDIVPGDYTFTWEHAAGRLTVTFPSTATGIDNTNAAVKVRKMIENGQIVIIRNGEKFNAQGQVIR